MNSVQDLLGYQISPCVVESPFIVLSNLWDDRGRRLLVHLFDC